jgi:hypothetical protein
MQVFLSLCLLYAATATVEGSTVVPLGMGDGKGDVVVDIPADHAEFLGLAFHQGLRHRRPEHVPLPPSPAPVRPNTKMEDACGNAFAVVLYGVLFGFLWRMWTFLEDPK